MYTYSTTQNNKWDFSQLYLKPKHPPSIHSSFGGKFICSMCFSSTLFYYSNSIVVVVGKKPKVSLTHFNFPPHSLSLSHCHDFPLLFFSLDFDFGFRATQTISLAPHIYRKCFCCSHKKAHDINFPSNSRHRRLRYVKGREREREKAEGQKLPRKPKAFSQTTNTWNTFAWWNENEKTSERGWWVVKNCWVIFLYEGRRRWGVTLCFRSSMCCLYLCRRS